MVKKSFFKKNKWIIFLVSLVIIAILFFVGFKLFLYVKYLIGNDLIIQLESDSNDMSLAYGQNKSVKFDMSRVTSPLCKTKCEYIFSDVSRNTTLSKGNFDFNSLSQKRYGFIFQDNLGEGQSLYRYTLVCRNVKTFLCHTSELPVSRDSLITVKYYPNEEQNNTKNMLSQRAYSAFNKTSIISSNVEYIKSKLAQLNKTLIIEEDYSKLSVLSNEIYDDYSLIEEFWKEGKYDSVESTLYWIDTNNDELTSYFIYLNKSVYSEINHYNNIIDSLHSYSSNLTQLSNRKFNQSDSIIVDKLIVDFNNNIDLFSDSLYIKDKENIALYIFQNDISNLSFENCSLVLDASKNCSYNINRLINFNITPIYISLPNKAYENFTLIDPLPECCVYDKCRTCGIVREYYPIIFIHGHDFNKDISAEYSLNAFQDIQNRLDSDGFINAGQLTLYDLDSNSPASLGYFGVPMTFRSTYYYDVLKESSSIYLPVQVKSENIDTYSIKLKTLIEKLKYETGQPKVIIVAHSMGGLVARRYIQLFGNDSVDKLIMIASPNYGITGDIKSLCTVFGAKAECTDLNSESLFLNTLNNNPSPYVKTYNIIGTGCDMKGEEGDGVVLKRNAELNNTKTYYINGNCSGINFLHNDLLYINKYPKVYSILKYILNETYFS